MSRKQIQGQVVSDVRDKTITVQVEQFTKHPLYGKRFRKLAKIHAHDEHNKAKKGDIVIIEETRPISKTKSFRLIQIIESVKGGE